MIMDEKWLHVGEMSIFVWREVDKGYGIYDEWKLIEWAATLLYRSNCLSCNWPMYRAFSKDIKAAIFCNQVWNMDMGCVIMIGWVERVETSLILEN